MKTPLQPVVDPRTGRALKPISTRVLVALTMVVFLICTGGGVLSASGDAPYWDVPKVQATITDTTFIYGDTPKAQYADVGVTAGTDGWSSGRSTCSLRRLFEIVDEDGRTGFVRDCAARGEGDTITVRWDPERPDSATAKVITPLWVNVLIFGGLFVFVLSGIVLGEGARRRKIRRAQQAATCIE